MATPDYESIIYFPFGGAEYDQCKAAQSKLSGLVTKSMSKIKTTLDNLGDKGAVDIIIVAHGKEKHSAHREPKLYSESGCFGVSKKSANTIVTELTNGLGALLSTEKVSGIYIWVCYSSSSGLGVSIANALKHTKIPVYATPLEIGGVGVWNSHQGHVGEDSFVLMEV